MSQNIVLVTVDSLRADHCGCYGYARETTPTLDEMASEGTIFENAIAPGPSTPESMPAIFTGDLPTDPVGTSGEGLERHRASIQAHLDRRETIPERLARRGYETGGFTPNPWTSHHFGFNQGFDHFRDFLDEDRSSAIWQRMLEGRGSKPLAAVRLLASWFQRENTFKPWRAFYDDVVDWVSRASEPYFLWVFLLDSHFPYFSSSRDRTQASWRTYEANLRLYLESQQTPYSERVHNQLVTAYDDSIRYVDRFLDRLRTDLRSDDPVFVVHADHGEAFGEHGTYGHHDQLYEPNIHVPLIVSGDEAGLVSRPLSLRALPKLLTNIADDDGNLGAIARRDWAAVGDESQLAIRGRDWKLLQEGSEETLYRLPSEKTLIRNEALSELGRELSGDWVETRDEQQRISTAATDVCVEEDL